MARQELARRLQELDMTESEARGYGALLDAVQGHIAQLFDLFESAFSASFFDPASRFRDRSVCERGGARVG